MNIQVYNSNDKLVFEGTVDELKNFTRNDSDRIVYVK